MYTVRKTIHHVSIMGVVLLCFMLLFSGCLSAAAVQSPDYSNESNWAYFAEGNNKPADVFLICPTVASGSDGNMNMLMTDEKSKKKFDGALAMERGIYEDSCRLFAPYYRQATLTTYTMEENDREGYLQNAYTDIRAAFEYYLKHENNGRPIVLAGFSQGADLCIRLVRDYFKSGKNRPLLVAAYAPGWHLTEKNCAENPQLRPAQGETDTGVIICFNSEDPGVTTSLIVPEKTLGINPLNWKIDSTRADAAENKGACFTDYNGSIKQEIPAFCGAYIDPVRGTLKVTGVDIDTYSSPLPLFPRGVYHLYDYQFFYRNLQENVAKRTAVFTAKKK